MVIRSGSIMEQEEQHVHGKVLRRNPLYLFACHLEWCGNGRLDAYQELIAALDDPDEHIRRVAETLLHRTSPRRQPRSSLRSVNGSRWDRGGTAPPAMGLPPRGTTD